MGLRGPLDSRISVETRPVVISRTIRVGLPVTATVTLLLQASIGPDHWTGTREPTGVVTASADSWMLTSVGCRMIQPETRNVRVLQGTCSAVTHAPERARTAVLYCKPAPPAPARPRRTSAWSGESPGILYNSGAAKKEVRIFRNYLDITFPGYRHPVCFFVLPSSLYPQLLCLNSIR